MVLGVLKLIRTYTKFSRIKTFEDRYEYLRIGGRVGEESFGFDRYLNQILYTSRRWRSTRDNVIIRDLGCDLGIKEYEIKGPIYIHHMNVLTIEDVELDRDEIYNPELLICTSFRTHQAIHYGNKSLLPKLPIIRKQNDTCPWR